MRANAVHGDSEDAVHEMSSIDCVVGALSNRFLVAAWNVASRQRPCLVLLSADVRFGVRNKQDKKFFQSRPTGYNRLRTTLAGLRNQSRL